MKIFKTPFLKLELAQTLLIFFILLLLVIVPRLLISFQSPSSLTLGRVAMPSDLGVIGLMSKHVLEHGEFPFFFWGQNWFGGLEAFLHGTAFWIFGISAWAMRVTPLFLFSLFCVLTFLIARDLFNERVGFLAMLWCAAAPMH